MALYGVDFYGASRYGPRVFLDYDASPLLASSNGFYGRLDLTWTIPVGGWSIIRLVRNAYGVPVDQDDGKVLVSRASGPAEPIGTRAAPIRRFTDDALEPGRFQYYSIWVYVPSVGEWTRAAFTTGLPLKDFGYSNRLWELLPSIYRTKTGSLLDPADNSELKTFLRVFGAGLDGVRAEYETLLNVNDPDKVSGNLLPLMAQQYGQFFEPELGMKQMRTLLRNTLQLYRSKGTIPGVTGFVSSVTGYGCLLKPLKNLMLDYNDSSAEESVGNWTTVSGATLSRYIADGAVNAAIDSIGSTMRRVGIFKMTATGLGSQTHPMSLAGADPRGRGIPVSPATAYTVSTYIRAETAARTIQLRVNWYSADGTLLSSSTSTGTASVIGSWTRGTHTATSPAGSVYAGLSLLVVATSAGEVHYFDAVQLEAGSTATDFEDARLIDVVAVAPRVNMVTNPSFEVNAVGWSGVTRDTTRFLSTPASGRITSTGTTYTQGVFSLPTDTLALSSSYTASAWVYVPAAVTSPISLVVNGPGVGSVASVPSSVKDTWVRLSVPFTTLATAGGVNVVVVDNTGGVLASGLLWNVDEVLLEKGSTLLPYFDGSTYQSTGDTIWGGAVHSSRSYFYPQRRIKNARVNALLLQYTPMGSSFRVLYAQP